jgi:hypothetical protein
MIHDRIPEQEAQLCEDFTGCILLMRCACWGELKTKEVALKDLGQYADDTAAWAAWLQPGDPYVNSATWAMSVKL